MAKVRVHRERCKGCGLCVVVCPRKNLKKGEAANAAGSFPVIVVDENDCTGCGLCFLMCPDVSIEVNP